MEYGNKPGQKLFILKKSSYFKKLAKLSMESEIKKEEAKLDLLISNILSGPTNYKRDFKFFTARVSRRVSPGDSPRNNKNFSKNQKLCHQKLSKNNRDEFLKLPKIKTRNCLRTSHYLKLVGLNAVNDFENYVDIKNRKKNYSRPSCLKPSKSTKRF